MYFYCIAVRVVQAYLTKALDVCSCAGCEFLNAYNYVCVCVHVCVCVIVEGDKVAQYAGLHLHKRIVDSHCYSKLIQV